MSEARTRIKYGDFEIEGSETLITESFIKEQLPEIVKTLATALRPTTGQTLSQTPITPHSTGGLTGELSITTNNIAAKLGCSSATDLIIAAAAHLHFVKGKAQFTRMEILDEMKSATSYFTETMRKNMSRNLSVAVRSNQLNERSKDTYALTSGTIAELSQKLSA
jgi:hypothetical protein